MYIFAHSTNIEYLLYSSVLRLSKEVCEWDYKQGRRESERAFSRLSPGGPTGVRSGE